jgi:CheY-like chemotaxis protein
LLHALTCRCERIGLEVRQARNFLTANNLIEKWMPDVICVDVNMPTGNGLQFCQSLADDPKTATVPIIVLTGQRDADTLQTCERLGAYYVPKRPDVWAELETVIQALISSARPTARPKSAGVRPRSLPANLIPPLPAIIHAESKPMSATKQVVVADDDPDLVDMLSQRLSSLGCSVVAAHNALDAINAIHRSMPDLVCLDVSMPSGSGLSVCEMMANDERLRQIPVIILTGRSDETTIRRCHDMLVFYVQKGKDVWSRIEPLVGELLHLDISHPGVDQKSALPADDRQPANGQPHNTVEPRDDLMDAVFAMLAADENSAAASTERQVGTAAVRSEQNPPWVLCIDDDADFSDAMKIRLEEHGVAVARAYSGMEGFCMVFSHPASAILLDYNMPNGQGDYILDRLKNNPVTKDIPVFVITGAKDKMLERRMMAMGAADFLHKPVDFKKLRDDLARYIDILATPAEAITASV